MGKLSKVFIMAGGTGGHVFPGLAVAKRLREQGVEVHWLGTEAGLEAKLVPAANLPIHFISISGMRGRGIKNILFTPFRLLLAIKQAWRILRTVKPDVVLGFGGFASGPGGIASWLLRYPLVIHEQNAIAGLTNRYLAHLATKVLEGFPGTFAKNTKVVAVGNPVRAEIVDIPAPNKHLTAGKKLRLLVLGGSLGAQAINDVVPRVLAKLPPEYCPEVWHQTGEKHFTATQQNYSALNLTGQVQVVPFIQQMDKAYLWAGIVLCRAGALTIAELCAAGLGAVLVPFPHAVDDHQTANAGYMVKNNAAILLPQAELTEEHLLELLKQFYLLPEKCATMAQAAYALRRVDATDRVATICEEICH